MNYDISIPFHQILHCHFKNEEDLDVLALALALRSQCNI